MLNPRWRKVIRDLWGNKTRTILVVLAIAVGVFAFGSTFITENILPAELDAQYHEARASTITMFLPSFDDSLISWAKRQKEVVDTQGRTVYMVKLLRGDKTYNLELYAYDDYENMSLNRVSLQTGDFPPGRRDILFERSSAPIAGVKAGDRVTVEMPDGSQRELNTLGTVHDVNAIPANMFPQLTGFVTVKTVGLLGLPGTYNRLEILTRPEYDSLEKLEKVAAELKERLQKDGIKVNSFQVRKPDEHWAKTVSQSFSLILTFIGFFSLVMSGFLVVNTMSALLTEQKRQIGMMKAIGGTGGQVIGIYLTLVVCYGLLALLVAVPVGMGLGYVFTMAVVRFLNIDLLNFHLPLSVFLMELIAALLVPVLAALVPIVGGVRVTVREALSNYGINGKQRHGFFSRMLLRARGLPRPVLLSLHNTFRRRARLLMTLGTLTLAGALFITVVNVRASLMAELDSIIKSAFNYEVALSLDGRYQGSGVERRAEGIVGVDKAEAQTSISVQRIKSDGTEGATFPVLGLSPGSDFVRPSVASGRWLQEGDRNAIVLTTRLVKDLPDIKVGDTITTKINNRKYTWEVVGITVMAWDRLAYADFDYVSRMRGEPGLANSMQVSTTQKDGQSQSEMAAVLEKQLKASGVKVVGSMTRNTITAANTSQFDFLVAFLLSMAAMTALIGGLGLAGMMSLNVMERTREIGVMRSIGASNGMIGGMVVTEGLLIGFISWLLAIPMSLPINLGFNAMLGNMMVDQPLVFAFSPIGLVGWLAIILIVSVIASLLPAYRAVRMSVRETLAYE